MMRRRGWLKRTAAFCAAVATSLPAAAQDATWNINGTGNFNLSANWTPNTVPTGTAFFGTSNQNIVGFTTSTIIGGWTFNTGASNYTFTTPNNRDLTFNGAGIAVIGGSVSIDNNRNLTFNNASSAGNVSIVNTAAIGNDRNLIFNDTSTAGSAVITNNNNLNFNNSSTAGNAIITNNDNLNFNNSSTAGNATITNSLGGVMNFFTTSTAGNATITNNDNLDFHDASTAGNATIISNGTLQFFNTSTASNATITNNATLEFHDTSTAGNANITNNGTLDFLDRSTGGNAAITNNLGGLVDFSASRGPNNDGKLSAGSIAGAGNFFLGAREVTVGGNNLSSTVSGIISDLGTGPPGGSLVKTGTGTLTLSGINTYTGTTTINGGTLALSGAGSIASSSGVNVASAAGVFDISATTAGATITTLSGVANSAVILGAETLTLSNASGTFNGVITGAGGFVLNAGTEILTGANTYTGGTTINAGTLQLGNGGTSGSIMGDVTDNGTLVVNRSDTYIFSGVISGTGGFQQNGTGTTVLTGDNTYTGGTTINSGTLVVDGSVANSSVTVNNGGLLAGSGTAGPTTINSGGRFAPGPTGSPGTMTVAGNLAFQSGALYVVQVNPSTASSTNLTGTAALAGTVQAVFAPGSYVTRNYTILHSTGLNGTRFAGLTGNVPANFTASLIYTATDAILNLSANLGCPAAGGAASPPTVATSAPPTVAPPTAGPGALPACGLSINQRNVASAINTFFNNGGVLPPNFLPLFNLTGGNLGNALSQLSGEAATGAQQAGFQLTNQFLGLMLDPFVDGRSGVAGTNGPALAFAPAQEAPPDEVALVYSAVLNEPKAPPPASFAQRWTAWGGGFGGANRTSGDPAVLGSHDLSARTAGFAGGLDYRLTRDTVVGVALAGGGTNWGLAQGLGSGKSDAFQAGVYGATRWGPAYLAAAFAYANHWMSTDRFAFAGDHLTASFNAQSIGGRVEGGYRFATFYGGVTPYAAIQAQSLRTPSYSETDVNNGGFALAYNSRTGTDTRSELGARFDRVLALYTNAVLSLRGRLAWAHDWVSDPSLAAVFQTLPGASFIVNGAVPAKDSALASAGAELRLANGVTLLGKFDGEFAAHAQTYAGTGTVRYTW